MSQAIEPLKTFHITLDTKEKCYVLPGNQRVRGLDDIKDLIIAVAVRKGYDVTIDTRVLPVGDLMCENHGKPIYIERKQAAELLGAHFDNRLRHQLQDLRVELSKGASAFLLISGDMSDINGRPSQLLGIQTKLAQYACSDVRIVPCFSDYHFVYAALHIFSCGSDYVPTYRTYSQTSDSQNQFIRMIKGIKGIGDKAAQMLLNYFGSIKAITEARLPEIDRALYPNKYNKPGKQKIKISHAAKILYNGLNKDCRESEELEQALKIIKMPLAKLRKLAKDERAIEI